MKKPIVVNFIGGPCSGKSTMCAGTYAKLKRAGVNCEMAPEYAKDKVWEENLKVLENQIYMFGTQYHRIFVLHDKVDVILTDCPLFLALHYSKNLEPEYAQFMLSVFNRYTNLNYFLSRTVKYDPRGRVQQTENEAVEIDESLEKLLAEHQIPYQEIEPSPSSEDKIVEFVTYLLNDK
jgi:nicotinamide riboside kinase